MLSLFIFNFNGFEERRRDGKIGKRIPNEQSRTSDSAFAEIQSAAAKPKGSESCAALKVLRPITLPWLHVIKLALMILALETYYKVKNFKNKF